MEAKLRSVTQAAIKNRVTPGGIVGIIRKNGERTVFPFGHFTYENNAQKVQPDSVYDLASITKAIPTDALALQLIDRGQLRLDDQLIEYLPEFSNNYRQEVRIKHLLTHTLTYAPGYKTSAYKELSAKEIKEAIFQRDFGQPPGEVFNYSNIPSYLLGLVIEKICGEPLDTLAKREFFEPLNMPCSFHPEDFKKEAIVPTEIDNWRGLVQGEIHDESAYAFKKDGVVVGHAGLFGTAGGLLTFLEMLLNEGTLAGKTYFSPEIVRQMHTNQLADLGEICGLGWELNQPRFMGKNCTEQAFGKTGFTGTLVVVDPSKKIGFVLLTNRTYPKRPADSTDIHHLRAAVGEIILM